MFKSEANCTIVEGIEKHHNSLSDLITSNFCTFWKTNLLCFEGILVSSVTFVIFTANYVTEDLDIATFVLTEFKSIELDIFLFFEFAQTFVSTVYSYFRRPYRQKNISTETTGLQISYKTFSRRTKCLYLKK